MKKSQTPAVEAVEVVTIPKMELRKAEFQVVGTTPLVMHRWSAKARQMMRDKQGKKATRGRETRDPQADVDEATYFISRDPVRYGFPALAFKAAMVDAAVALGVKKTQVRRAFHIVADANSVLDGPLVEVFCDDVTAREDMVRVGMGTADLRYRPQFNTWRVNLRLNYDARQLSISQLVTLLDQAGFSTGVGDWRVEKDGESGQFRVESAS